MAGVLGAGELIEPSLAVALGLVVALGLDAALGLAVALAVTPPVGSALAAVAEAEAGVIVDRTEPVAGQAPDRRAAGVGDGVAEGATEDEAW